MPGSLGRDFVRQRANLVRLSGHHIQRVQKALELMNLKLTNVVEDVTGHTGLKIIRAILAGERDAQKLASFRDRRCKHSEAEIATALDGWYRNEHLLELRCCFYMWEQYLKMIVEVDRCATADHEENHRAAATVEAKARSRSSTARSGVRRADGVVSDARPRPDRVRRPR